MLKSLLKESRLDQLYKEMREHIRCYKIAKAAGNEWQREDCLKKIKLLAPEIKHAIPAFANENVNESNRPKWYVHLLSANARTFI